MNKMWTCNDCGFSVPADIIGAELMKAHLADDCPTEWKPGMPTAPQSGSVPTWVKTYEIMAEATVEFTAVIYARSAEEAEYIWREQYKDHPDKMEDNVNGNMVIVASACLDDEDEPDDPDTDN